MKIKNIPIFSLAVFEAIRETIGKLPPESGGLICGDPKTDSITYFFFDKKAISNYLNQVSNATASVVMKSVSSSSVTASTQAFPSLTNLNINGAIHVMGPPETPFTLPAGSSLQLANVYVYGDDLSSQGLTDYFGNPVYDVSLLEIDGVNSFLVASDGTSLPCPVQASTDLINWNDVEQVVLLWNGRNANQTIVSQTSVTMTTNLQPYATNWVRLDGNGQIVESFTIARPPWPIGSKRGFVRLGIQKPQMVSQ